MGKEVRWFKCINCGLNIIQKVWRITAIVCSCGGLASHRETKRQKAARIARTKGRRY